MYRRRPRRRADIAFGFDSFLDVVANVCGIIIRLILVAWVGGRSYSALMQWRETAPEPEAAATLPKPDDEPLSAKITATEAELAAVRQRLSKQLEALAHVDQQRRSLASQWTALRREREALARQRRELEGEEAARERAFRLTAVSLDEVRKRQQAVLAEIRRLEALPAPVKELRYRTPVSRVVQADELFFELQADRVAFIDIQAFLQEVQSGVEGRGEELRTRFKIEEVTRQVGAFRLRYCIEREAGAVDEFGQAAKPTSQTNFRYGVSGWQVEPLEPTRGEPWPAALAPGSEFRRIVDALDATTVVTFWVYPDSFEAFRRLRDYLYERGLEVAGRPLPHGAPIAASRYGTASRGQ
ncbi:MAG: hypothetical protein NZO58_06405 [Gemmataceae bacterium]|nr:hypothetical protein [Gemmataceae bacterium]